MSPLWIEFSEVAVAHLLAAASPGPDFAVVVRQSLNFGRRTAIWTSVGIGTAILLHVTYSLLGLGLLIRGSHFWFTVVKFCGAAYIAWLGIQSLRAKPAVDVAGGAAPLGNPPTRQAAFFTGFFTNALNPKVMLLFLSLFLSVIDPMTPKIVQCGYGLWMVLVTIAWFCLVSVVFARDDVRRKFLRHGHWIDRALGVVFLGFAVSLIVTTVR
jgi:RhtB (resistance to homoserine/threonine) family protein